MARVAISGRTRGLIIALLLSSAAALTWHYTTTITLPRHDQRMELHGQILDGEAVAPYRYRLLIPWAAEGIARVLSTFLRTESAYRVAYITLDWLALSAALLFLYSYLTRWVCDVVALVTVLFLTGTMSLTFQEHFYQPWSVPEMAFVALSMLLILDDRRKALLPIVLLASLNRSTGVLLPLAFALTPTGTTRAEESKDEGAVGRLIWAGGYFTLWAAVFFGLRAWLGMAEPHEPLTATLAMNLRPRSVTFAVVQTVLLFGVLWPLAAVGFSSAPRFLRRMTLLLPLYIVPVLIWGRWIEVRLLLAMFPVVAPLAAIGLETRLTPDESSEAEE